MKTLLTLAIGLLSCFSAASCNNEETIESVDLQTAKQNILVVYFSRAGHNYPDPQGKPLTIGNTARVAESIASLTHGDKFEIMPVKSYPDDYRLTTEIASREKENNARPAIKNTISNIQDYSTIFLGYPIWWGTAPMIIRTFLDTYDLTGKTVIPFCTHHGSGLGSSVSDIKKALTGTTVKDGLAIWDNNIDSARDDIEKWLKRHYIIK